GLIVNNGRRRRFQAQVGAIAVEAGVIGEAVAVAAEVQLVVGLVEGSGGHNEFRFVAALEAGARGNVEDTVGAVAIIGGVAPTLCFERVHVFGIDLRAKIASDVAVGDGDAVKQPAHLMAATDVELVVGEVSAGNVVGDGGKAVG